MRPIPAPLLAAALLAASACQEASAPLAPPAPPADPAHAFAAPPALLAAVGDAESRVAPALAAPAREPVRAALAELHAALDAGQRGRATRAAVAVRALLAAPPDSTDAADRAAIGMLLDVAADAARPTGEAR